MTVLWTADFETGDISQWEASQAASPDRLQVVTSPVRQGKYALKVEVHHGDLVSSGNRAELVRTVHEKEGDDRYYAWSTMWPSDYPSEATWQLFTQWHHTGSSGSPPFEMYVNGEKMYLRVQASDVLWTAPLVRGSWRDFILHVKWSSDATVGFVEMWLDGAQVLPKKSAATMYAGQENYLKQGLYRDGTIMPIGVIFHDGMRMATSLDDVTPPADAGTDATSTEDAPAVDSATIEDAAIDTAPAEDAATDSDAPAAVATDESSGCGCRTPRRAGGPGPLSALLLALLLGTRGARASRRR